VHFPYMQAPLTSSIRMQTLRTAPTWLCHSVQFLGPNSYVHTINTLPCISSCSPFHAGSSDGLHLHANIVRRSLRGWTTCMVEHCRALPQESAGIQACMCSCAGI
jgi:hypothetical protein